MSKKVLRYKRSLKFVVGGMPKMKRKFFISTIFVFLFLFASVQVYASQYKTEVSVGIKYGSSSGNSVSISSCGVLNIYHNEYGTIIYTSQPSETINIEMGSTGFASWNKFDASGCTRLSIYPSEGNTIQCDGIEYRGYIVIEKHSNGELLVINYVNIDDYVSSVLGKEMSYTWPKEALKAQAICARNFVLTRGSSHKEYGFDVCSTTHCQVYGGVKSEHVNTRIATEETRGIVAKYQGELVGLYFFATSGGATEDSENVWGGKYGYLRSVPDTYENPEKASKYRWTVTLTKSEIETKLLNAGVNIGSLKKIDVVSYSDSGRVLQMTFVGTEGSHTVTKEKCRTILGLYSQKFTIKGDSCDSIITTAGTAMNSNIFAISASGIGMITNYSAISGNNSISYVSVEGNNSGSYVINGGGYGHGVGMSQWGARGMAENGFTYDQILHHYFTGIELE